MEEREVPVFVVTTEAPGYSAERVEATVTMPLERELAGLHTKVQAVSSAGKSVITVFAVNVTDSLIYGIRGCISRAALPDGAASPRLEHYIDPRYAMRYTLQSDAYTPAELLRWHESVLAAEFARVPGVRRVFSVGGRRECRTVVSDLSLLKKYGVDINAFTDAVENGLANTDFRVPAAADLPGMAIAPGVLLKDLARVDLSPCDGPGSVAKDRDDGLPEGIVVFDGRQSGEEMAAAFFSVLENIKKAHPRVSVTPFYTGCAKGGGQIAGRQLRVWFSPGTDRAQKAAFCAETRALLGSVPGVRSVVSETGFSLNGYAVEEQAATFYIVTDGKTDVETALREKLRPSDRAVYRFLPVSEGDGSAVRYIRISGPDRMESLRALRAVRDDLSAMAGISAICDESGGETPTTEYVIRHEEAARHGVSLSGVMRAVEAVSGGKTWVTDGFPVRMELLPGQAEKIDTYPLLKVHGKWIGLPQVSEKRVHTVPAVLRRENGQPYTELVFTAADAQAVRAVEERFGDPASRPASIPREAVIEIGKAVY